VDEINRIADQLEIQELVSDGVLRRNLTAGACLDLPA
jgi:hypothetical protein